MTWGFERGKRYNRTKDIHDRFVGQPQGGIITPAAAKLVIAITGKRGKAHGYEDREMPDGSFEYFGAGRYGDQSMTDRNLGLLQHSQASKSLLFFEEAKRQLKFLGEYVCEAYEWRRAPDANKQMRNAIVFRLRPLENIIEVLESPHGIDRSLDGLTLEQLRELAYQASQPTAPGRPRKTTVYERSRHVSTYVLRRAKGLCEYDGEPAPFSRSNGEPYLEPHHIERVSDGGPDHPKHVIALCPNCHRRAHSAADKNQFKAQLVERMNSIEPDDVVHLSPSRRRRKSASTDLQ
ncbi:HNH endonuclease [Ensifer sp. LBL]|uniref:HNH endonuclease n=1 Tax=Ensifer sp. LBL TaxID=2991056 RepID=UPI003D20414A